MKRLLFVRHGIALERLNWEEDDLLRPLSEKGIDVSRSFFSKLPKIYDIGMIITSLAERASHTAKLLYEAYPGAILVKDERLNPGCTYEDFEELFDSIDETPETVAIVGHEPDFSEIVSVLVSETYVRTRLKKPSVVDIEMLSPRTGELRNLITPKILKNLQ